MPAAPARFAALFNQPTIEQMYALSPREFERYVGYFPKRAGFQAKEVGPPRRCTISVSHTRDGCRMAYLPGFKRGGTV